MVWPWKHWPHNVSHRSEAAGLARRDLQRQLGDRNLVLTCAGCSVSLKSGWPASHSLNAEAQGPSSGNEGGSSVIPNNLLEEFLFSSLDFAPVGLEGSQLWFLEVTSRVFLLVILEPVYCLTQMWRADQVYQVG